MAIMPKPANSAIHKPVTKPLGLVGSIKRVYANYIFARNETLFCSDMDSRLTFKEWVNCIKRACTFKDIAE